MRHPTALLVLMRRLFTWRQIPKMLQIKALLDARDRGKPGHDGRKNAGTLLGECDLIMSFLIL